jgi:thiaminase/transcriptional activator TenA
MSYCFDDLKNACRDDWQAYVQHDFVRQLGAGTLDADGFRHYLQQDYLFIMHFARAYALAIYKSRNMAELRHAFGGLKMIVDVELGLHIDYCRQWGITEDDLARLPEARQTMAYTRYVLDTGNRGDLLDMHVALAPCLVGYGEVANFLNGEPTTIRAGNPYDAWIGMYESDAFQAAMRSEVDWLNSRLASVTEPRFAELAAIFRDATRLEIDFWQMGLDQAGAPG